jgi:hypothetical protein
VSCQFHAPAALPLVLLDRGLRKHQKRKVQASPGIETRSCNPHEVTVLTARQCLFYCSTMELRTSTWKGLFHKSLLQGYRHFKPAWYLAGPGFLISTGRPVSFTELYVVFFSLSREMQGQYLKLGHGRFVTLWINSKEHRPHSQSYSHWGSKEIGRLLQNRKVHNSPLPVPNLTYVYTTHALPFSVRPFLILSSYLCLGFPSDLFLPRGVFQYPSRFSTH